ncbi:MAG: hypothetical protein KGZ82_07965 [Bacteroidales bacterium]|nr:hypothetical protein [Bacteroidales bacterium]
MMKFLRILSLIGLFSSFLACHTQKPTSKDGNKNTIEDHSSKPYAFPTGTYYQFVFNGKSAEGIDVKTLLLELLNLKIPWTDAWYKGPARMCVPPGSDMGMQVIVEPAFIVRLEKQHDGMLQKGFVKTAEPGLGDCAFRVTHFSR